MIQVVIQCGEDEQIYLEEETPSELTLAANPPGQMDIAEVHLTLATALKLAEALIAWTNEVKT